MDKAETNIEHIKTAVKEMKNKKPGLEEMLNLYEQIFILQEKTKALISLSEFSISDEILSLKIKEKFPLVNISQFQIDYKASETLLLSIIDLMSNKEIKEDEISNTTKLLSSLIQDNKIIPKELFDSFIKEDESYFEVINEKYKINKEILGFLVFNSLKPSIVSFSEKISQYLEKTEWEKGYCPICGSMPELSVFEKDGKRFLICGFCSHKWASKRIYCPFCENTDHETLQYFSIDDEEEYRVDTCDKCKCYIKTINTEQTTREIYFPLESHITLYINAKFDEMGYTSGQCETCNNKKEEFAAIQEQN